MKYDDASWHYGGEFPDDLPDEAGGTHTGMFVAWALLSGLGGNLHTSECPEDVETLQARTITPGAWFLRFCDGKFTDEDLSELGNAFATHYFKFEGDGFIADYTNLVPDHLPSLYHMPDSWETFELLKPVFDRRFDIWRRGA
ncbi:MAG: hypothetical protein U1F30_10990 [Steroidobacteraceae bacterium]